MWTKQEVKREVDKVRVASLGEVILFTGPNLINMPYRIAGTHAEVQANVGIYEGYSEAPAQSFRGGKIRCVFKTDANIEIAIAEEILGHVDLREIDENGQVIRTADNITMIYLMPNVKEMWLDRKGTTTYVGPDEVTRFLHDQSKGALDEFIREYIARFRNVKE